MRSAYRAHSPSKSSLYRDQMADPLSILGGLVGVVATGAQLSLSLYEISNRIVHAPKEVAELASEMSLLSSTLGNLGEVLREGKGLYKHRMISNTKNMLSRIKDVHRDIRKMTKDAKGLRRLGWVFRSVKAKALLAKIDSLKLTLSLTLATMQLALRQKKILDKKYDTSQAAIEENQFRKLAESLVEANRQSFQKLQEELDATKGIKPKIPSVRNDPLAPDSNPYTRSNPINSGLKDNDIHHWVSSDDDTIAAEVNEPNIPSVRINPLAPDPNPHEHSNPVNSKPRYNAVHRWAGSKDDTATWLYRLVFSEDIPPRPHSRLQQKGLSTSTQRPKSSAQHAQVPKSPNTDPLIPHTPNRLLLEQAPPIEPYVWEAKPKGNSGSSMSSSIEDQKTDPTDIIGQKHDTLHGKSIDTAESDAAAIPALPESDTEQSSSDKLLDEDPDNQLPEYAHSGNEPAKVVERLLLEWTTLPTPAIKATSKSVQPASGDKSLFDKAIIRYSRDEKKLLAPPNQSVPHTIRQTNGREIPQESNPPTITIHNAENRSESEWAYDSSDDDVTWASRNGYEPALPRPIEPLMSFQSENPFSYPYPRPPPLPPRPRSFDAPSSNTRYEEIPKRTSSPSLKEPFGRQRDSATYFSDDGHPSYGIRTGRNRRRRDRDFRRGWDEVDEETDSESAENRHVQRVLRHVKKAFDDSRSMVNIMGIQRSVAKSDLNQTTLSLDSDNVKSVKFRALAERTIRFLEHPLDDVLGLEASMETICFMLQNAVARNGELTGDLARAKNERELIRSNMDEKAEFTLELQKAKDTLEKEKETLEHSVMELKKSQEEREYSWAHQDMKHTVELKNLQQKLESRPFKGKILNIFSPAPRDVTSQEASPILLLPSRLNPSYPTQSAVTNVSKASINTAFYKNKDRSIALELDDEQKRWDLSNHILGTLAWEPPVVSSTSELYLSLKHNGWNPTYVRATEDGETIYMGENPVHINFANPNYIPQLPSVDLEAPSGWVAIGEEWVEGEALKILGFEGHLNHELATTSGLYILDGPLTANDIETLVATSLFLREHRMRKKSRILQTNTSDTGFSTSPMPSPLASTPTTPTNYIDTNTDPNRSASSFLRDSEARLRPPERATRSSRSSSFSQDTEGRLRPPELHTRSSVSKSHSGSKSSDESRKSGRRHSDSERRRRAGSENGKERPRTAATEERRKGHHRSHRRAKSGLRDLEA